MQTPPPPHLAPPAPADFFFWMLSGRISSCQASHVWLFLLLFTNPQQPVSVRAELPDILQTPIFILWLDEQCVFTANVGNGLESVCKFGFVTKYAGEQKPCSLFVEVPGMLLFNNLPSQC